MNKPLFDFNAKGDIIVKALENLKNKSGKYSDKNKNIVDILNKCLSLKSLGCNFIVDVEFGEDTFYTTDKGNIKGHSVKKVSIAKDISNAIVNLNLCMTDRVFIPTHNDKGAYMVTCLSIEKWQGVNVLTREKGASMTTSLEVHDIFDSTKKDTVILATSKGLRPITDDEISEIKSNLNAMLGIGFNKEIFSKVKEA